MWQLLSGLLLSSCLDRPLATLSERKDQEEIITSYESQENVDREAYFEELSSWIHKDSSGDSSLEELIRLLREMNEDPARHALSMSELRTLQNLMIESGGTALRALMPVGPSLSPQTNENSNKAIIFDISNPTDCPALPYETKVLPSGLRVISGLPRKDTCSLKLSKIYQDLLNQILKEGEVLYTFGGRHFKSRSLESFFSNLEQNGFEIEISYRTYLAPFVRLYEAEGDPYEAENEIPLALWLKTGVQTKSKRDVVVPAPHSEVFFKIKASESEFQRSSEAQFKIYFSDKGFVFDDEDLFLPHWAGLRSLEVVDAKDRENLLGILSDLHKTYEIFKSQAPQNLPLGGFGLLGVCNDGSALAMRALRGMDFVAPFPLVRTDRVKMPDSNFPLKELWNSFQSDTWENVAHSRELMIRRIQRGNPFEGVPHRFPHFEESLRELQQERANP